MLIPVILGLFAFLLAADLTEVTFSAQASKSQRLYEAISRLVGLSELKNAAAY